MSEEVQPITVKIRETRDTLNEIVGRVTKDQRVLNAFYKVDRQIFVPQEYLGDAYSDMPLTVETGASISQPTLVVRMLEALELKGGEKVFEIGTATGYEAAILSYCGCTVYTTEILQTLFKKASEAVEFRQIENVHVFNIDGVGGLPEQAPFDAIISSAALREIPQELIDQLTEGGTIVAPVGKDPYVQKLLIGKKINGKFCIKYDKETVRFYKATSQVKGGWTEDLIEKSKKLKQDHFKSVLDNKQGYFNIMDLVNEACNQKIKPTFENLVRILSEREMLPDTLYKGIENNE